MQTKFKLGEKVICIPDVCPTCGAQEAENAFIKTLGIGTIVGVPHQFEQNEWATADDTAWVIWENNPDPKWLGIDEIRLAIH